MICCKYSHFLQLVPSLAYVMDFLYAKKHDYDYGVVN